MKIFSLAAATTPTPSAASSTTKATIQRPRCDFFSVTALARASASMSKTSSRGATRPGATVPAPLAWRTTAAAGGAMTGAPTMRPTTVSGPVPRPCEASGSG